MSKVLFTHSYFYRFDPKQWRAKQPYPPLATIQAAAVVRQAGFPVLLFDTNLKESPDEIRPLINHEKPAYLVIYDDGFNYLTKMCLTNMREAAFKMAAMGKQAGCTVIVNSSDATDQYESYLNNGVDYVVRGEGEETLKELLTALQEEKGVSSISGLAFRPASVPVAEAMAQATEALRAMPAGLASPERFAKASRQEGKQAGQTILTPSRQVLRHLDTLPLPAWDLVDIQSYKEIWLKKHGYFSLNIATTRGCPFKCNWCAKPIYGNRYNSRSPIQVIEEIDFLIQHYQPDHFWMCDDIFGLRPGWVQEFRNIVQQRGLKFRYKIQSRVDLLLQEDTIDALAQSGAETVWVGAESGSQKILDAMDKGTTLDQISMATSHLKKKGISVAFFLQFGYLGETQQDIDATIQMVLKLMPDEIGISVSYPLPGTKFYEKVKDQLKVKRNWTDSNDLEMMFEGTYPPAFYRILHRYVHNRYRIQRGRQMLKFFSKQRASFRFFASMLYNLPLAWLHAYQLQKIHHAHARS